MLHFLASFQLPALEHLSSNLKNPRCDGDYTITKAVADMNEAVLNLIPSLSALQSIKTGGPFEEHTLRTVLDHCGHRLRRLLLSTYDAELLPVGSVGVDFVQEIQRKCPNLEELALTVLRSKDDATGIAIYRALGTLASIRRIHLNICCPQSFLQDTDSISHLSMICARGRALYWDQETELDDALTNIAIDGSLARTIFRIISTSKPAYSPPLERLSLGVEAMRDFSPGFRAPDTHLEYVLRYIGRSWTCIRNPRDDRPHDCFITEYNPADKLERERVMENDVPFSQYDLATKEAICHVWPAASTTDWKQVWHSFELDTSG
jgi:hypothetical protein